MNRFLFDRENWFIAVLHPRNTVQMSIKTISSEHHHALCALKRVTVPLNMLIRWRLLKDRSCHSETSFYFLWNLRIQRTALSFSTEKGNPVLLKHNHLYDQAFTQWVLLLLLVFVHFVQSSFQHVQNSRVSKQDWTPHQQCQTDGGSVLQIPIRDLLT